MGAVHRHALRLVDGRSIAVVDPVVILQVELNGPAIIGAHGHALGADLFDGAERAVLHAKPALVLQEHDAIPGGEGSITALDPDARILAQIAGLPHALARLFVEFAHLYIGVGEDDAARFRSHLPFAIPTVDQIGARLFARWRLIHHVVAVIGTDCSIDPAGGQVARGIALPVFSLATHGFDLDAAMPLMDRAKRCTGLDRLQLLWIADQDDLCASLGGMGEHALQLARADHAGLVDHENIARGQHITALSPAMFHAGDGA